MTQSNFEKMNIPRAIVHHDRANCASPPHKPCMVTAFTVHSRFYGKLLLHAKA